MGIDYTVFIGPYITYEMPKKKDAEYWFSCSKKDCNSGGVDVSKFKHCPECGTIIKKSSRSIESDAYCIYDDFLYDFEESLCLAGDYVEDNVLLPNFAGHGKSLDPRNDLGLFELPDKETGLKKFKEDYAEEIKILKSKLKNVKVHWGIVCDAG